MRRKKGKAGGERGRLRQVREVGKSVVQRETHTTERAGGENQKMHEAALSRGRTRLRHSGKRNANPTTHSEVEVSPI